MAQRPAFLSSGGKIVGKTYSFEWFPGFAVSQKQKSMESLHNAIRAADPAARPLEVSTKSKEALGQKLSAFRLALGGRTLENIFQSAKVFERGGPYPDLLEIPPREAKRDERLKSSGALTAFRWQGRDFPLTPLTVFYDYIYFSAVKESLTPEEISQISSYNYFTDIEFNPAKSINTQARTAALLGLMLEEYGRLPDFSADDFIAYHKARIIYQHGARFGTVT